MTFVFIYERFVIGGAETYLIRMFKWCKNNNYRRILFISKDTQIDELLIPILKELQVEIITLEDNFESGTYSLKKFSFEFDKNQRIIFITLELSGYFLGEQMIRKFSIPNFLIMLYVLHPYNTVHKSKFYILNTLYKLFYGKIINKMLSNNSLIFMDEETRDFCFEYYNLNIDKEKAPIFRIGMEIGIYNEEIIKKRYKSNDLNILSICRFDFPFKGYVLGLIDTYKKLKIKYANLKITFIGYGSGLNELSGKIKLLPSEFQKDIEIIGKVPYEGLSDYFDKATVCVGMGTTILDASNTGLISIVATGYQINEYAFGFFHNDYRKLGGVLGEKGSKDFGFYNLLDSVFNLEEDKYVNISRKTYDVFAENYNIDIIMKQIINLKNNRNTPIVSKNILFFLKNLNNIKYNLRLLYKFLINRKR